MVEVRGTAIQRRPEHTGNRGTRLVNFPVKIFEFFWTGAIFGKLPLRVFAEGFTALHRGNAHQRRPVLVWSLAVVSIKDSWLVSFITVGFL